jgi:hypothetical protein
MVVFPGALDRDWSLISLIPPFAGRQPRPCSWTPGACTKFGNPLLSRGSTSMAIKGVGPVRDIGQIIFQAVHYPCYVTAEEVAGVIDAMHGRIDQRIVVHGIYFAFQRAKPRRSKFTELALKRLKPPKEKQGQYLVWDTRANRAAGLVSKSTKTFRSLFYF